jgi:acyl dehydratase
MSTADVGGHDGKLAGPRIQGLRLSVGSPDGLAEIVGETATGDWLEIDQDRIRAFADATGDWQWIHVDEQRAKDGPFGGTIAHGYLTLSLLPSLTEGLIGCGGTEMAVNYGLDRVRFLQPVRSGSRVRAVAQLQSTEQTPQGVRASIHVTVELEGSDRPALVADTITLYVPASATRPSRPDAGDAGDAGGDASS